MAVLSNARGYSTLVFCGIWHFCSPDIGRNIPYCRGYNSAGALLFWSVFGKEHRDALHEVEQSCRLRRKLYEIVMLIESARIVAFRINNNRGRGNVLRSREGLAESIH